MRETISETASPRRSLKQILSDAAKATAHRKAEEQAEKLMKFNANYPELKLIRESNR